MSRCRLGDECEQSLGRGSVYDPQAVGIGTIRVGTVFASCPLTCLEWWGRGGKQWKWKATLGKVGLSQGFEVLFSGQRGGNEVMF